MQNNVVSKDDLLPINSSDINQNYTIIKLDGEQYAIKTKNILEITKVVDLDIFPQMLSYIIGVVQYKNQPIGVIDLREIFNKERVVYDLSAKIIILSCNDIKTAIICDSVADIVRIDKDKIHPLPYEQQYEFYEGLFTKDDESFYVIDIEGIIKYASENVQKFANKETKNYLVSDSASKGILKERRNALNAVDNDFKLNISLYDIGVSFIINNIKYYINMANVREFFKVRNSKFIKVPCTPDYIFGLINIKGEYITIVDIRMLYGTSKTKARDKSTIIVLNSDEFKIGILADEILESFNVDFSQFQNKHTKSDESKMFEFSRNGEIYHVIDVERLLKDERLLIC